MLIKMRRKMMTKRKKKKTTKKTTMMKTTKMKIVAMRMKILIGTMMSTGKNILKVPKIHCNPKRVMMERGVLRSLLNRKHS
jgi:hypothetical protein